MRTTAVAPIDVPEEQPDALAVARPDGTQVGRFARMLDDERRVELDARPASRARIR